MSISLGVEKLMHFQVILGNLNIKVNQAGKIIGCFAYFSQLTIVN